MTRESSNGWWHAHRMILRHHAVFGQWYVPNVKAYVPHERGYFIVETNRLGMRSSRDYAEHQEAARCRILLFGDSFTAGWGVHNRERFSDRLQSLLDDTEVLNFGLDGSGIDQHLLIFEELGSRFGGDLVLYCPLIENIRRVTLSHWLAVDRATGRTLLVPKPYFVLQGGRLECRNVPVPKDRQALAEAGAALQAPFRSRTLKHLIGRLLGPMKPAVITLTRYQPYPQYASPHHPAWRLTEALLARLVAQAQPRPVVIAPLPLSYWIEQRIRPVYLERFREFAQQHPQTYVVDLLPYFHALTPRERRRYHYTRDDHYSPLGHEVVARALAAELLRLGLLHRRTVQETFEV